RDSDVGPICEEADRENEFLPDPVERLNLFFGRENLALSAEEIDRDSNELPDRPFAGTGYDHDALRECPVLSETGIHNLHGRGFFLTSLRRCTVSRGLLFQDNLPSLSQRRLAIAELSVLKGEFLGVV